MPTKDYQLNPLKYLQQQNNIWQPYAFDRVQVSGTVPFSILGICYSEYKSGPNLRHLADIGLSLTGPGQFGLASCRSLGHSI